MRNKKTSEPILCWFHEGLARGGARLQSGIHFIENLTEIGVTVIRGGGGARGTLQIESD